jgi:hypothetical protein
MTRMLTVHITSFSYLKAGIPPDEWGHGGGFVFDCRCLPNPGRLGQFAPLTGLDAAVVALLDEDPRRSGGRHPSYAARPATGGQEALWRHKLAGNPVVIWKQRREEWVQPADIPARDGAEGSQ